MKIPQKLRRTFSAIVWTGVVAATGLYSVAALANLNACDAEWHQNGELPDWANVSFSESNNPTPKPRRKRQKAAPAKKTKAPDRGSRVQGVPPEEDDDGFIRYRED